MDVCVRDCGDYGGLLLEVFPIIGPHSITFYLVVANRIF